MMSPFIIMIFAMKLFQSGVLSIGEAMSVHSLSGTFFNMANSIFNSYWGFAQSNVYMERMSDIITQETDNQQGKKTPDIRGNILLKNVFRRLQFLLKKRSKQ